MKTKTLKTVRKLVNKHGFSIESFRLKKHEVIKLVHCTGAKRTLVTSQSPSDWRAFRTIETDLRRLRDGRTGCASRWQISMFYRIATPQGILK